MQTTTQGAPPNQHVTVTTEHDRFGRLFLHYRCGICRDLSTKQCMNPARAPHWLQYYVTYHPPRPHTAT